MAKKSRKSAKKPGTKSSSRPSSGVSPPKHVPMRGLYGWITHTDFASSDPAATKAWCAKVLGWTFKPSLPARGGEYHLFAYSAQGGGGIHPTGPSESPGSVPFVHVADAATAFAKAIQEEAEAIMGPNRVMEGVTLAIVRAPGGITIGFFGP